MKKPAKILGQKLKNAERVAVLGIGSDLRGDDIAGIRVVEQTEKSFDKAQDKLVKSQTSLDSRSFDTAQDRFRGNDKVKFFIGATAPENLTGEIKKFQPTHLIIIDSVYSKAQPGEIIVMKPQELEEISFFTHKLPVKVMIDYLLQFCKCTVIIVGIVPKNTEFGSPVSKEVSAAVKKLGKIIAEILCG